MSVKKAVGQIGGKVISLRQHGGDSPFEGAFGASTAGPMGDFDVTRIEQEEKDSKKRLSIRIIAALGGAVLLGGMVFADFVTGTIAGDHRNYEITSEGAYLDPNGNVLGNAQAGNLSTVGAHHRNPDVSWFERYFCRGYRNSVFCSRRARHPHIESMKEMGMATPEWQEERSYQVRQRIDKFGR